MKTPRELLFDKHRESLPALDQVRRNALAAIVPAGSDQRLLFARAAARLWAELVLPSRRIWAGLAVAWVFIFGFGLALTLETTSAPVNRAPLSRETVAALRRQSEEFKQLVQLNMSEPADVLLPSKPQPRSDRKPACLIG